MITIYKLVDGIETEVNCTTQEGAEAMVKSNSEKYSFKKRIEDDSFNSDFELIKEIEELKSENSILRDEIEILKKEIEDLQAEKSDSEEKTEELDEE